MKKILLIFVLGIMLFTSGCGKKDVVVLNVDEESIAREEFDWLFSEYQRKKISDLPKGLDREEYLAELVFRVMVYLEGYKKGFQEDPLVQRTLKTEKKRLLLKVLGREEVGKKTTVSEEEVRERYDLLEKEVNARHILVNTIEEAERARQRIMKGEPFSEVAREVSLDTNSAARGGDLGFLPWGKMVSPFNDVAFSLSVGQMSEPVRTAHGHHIILVESIRQKDGPSLDEDRDRIFSLLMEEKKEASGAAYLDSIASGFDFVLNREVFDLFLQYNLTAREGTKELYDVIDESEYDLCILTYNGTDYTIGQYIEELETYPPWKRAPMVNPLFLERFIEGIIMEYHLAETAENYGMEGDPLVEWGLRKKLRSLLYDRVYQMRVQNNVHIEDNDLKDYYDSHLDEFAVPERVLVREILVATEEEALDALERVTERGEDFAEVAREVSISRSALHGGSTGIFSVEVEPEIAGRKFKLVAGEITGPVEVKRGYMIALVEHYKDPGIRDFQDMKNRIRSILKMERELELKEKYRKELLLTYDVRSFPERLK